MSQEPNNRRVRSVWNRSWVLFPLAMMLLLFFRIYYGLSMDFWNDDERQIYLMGLQWATTGAWPFFGPDVIHTHQQIAGALQPLLVGGPLLVLPLPESPILMVNLLSFGGLSLLSLYLCRLIPEAPRIIIFAWLLTLPWSLNISSHVYNPSYLLFSSCLFFVGFAEIAPGLRTGLLHQAMAFFLLGFGLAWSMQLHLSWPLLLPFMAVAIFLNAREGRLGFQQASALAAGFTLPCLLLLPTVWKYGPGVIFSPLLANSGVNQGNVREPLTILARFLSLAAYEVPRFISDPAATRLPYLLAHPWLIPLALIIGVIGLIQPLLFIAGLFRRATPSTVKWLVILSMIEIFAAFAGSTRPPTARNYYILFPVAAICGIYGMRFVFATEWRKRVAGSIILLGMTYQGLLALSHLTERSLYNDRTRVVQALSAGDYRRMGERRPDMQRQ